MINTNLSTTGAGQLAASKAAAPAISNTDTTAVVPKESVASADQEIAALKEQVAQLQQLAGQSGKHIPSFSELSESERNSIRGKLETLAQKGRLFRQSEPDSELVKASASDVLHSIDHHIGMTWVVEGVGHLEEGKRTANHRWEAHVYKGDEETNTTHFHTNYTGSPILAWQDFELIDTSAPGLKGVSTLPKPNGNILTAFEEGQVSSYWRATSWVHEIPTGETFVTGTDQGRKEHWKKWNL